MTAIIAMIFRPNAIVPHAATVGMRDLEEANAGIDAASWLAP